MTVTGRLRRSRAAVEDTQERLRASRPEVPAVDVGFTLYERDRELAGGILSGALAYRFFFTLVPLTLVLVVGFGYLHSLDSTAPGDAAREFGIDAAAASSVAESAGLSSQSRGFILVAGVAALLWAAFTSLRALRIVHALAWGLPDRHWPRALAGSLAYLIVVVLGVLTAGGTAFVREHLGLGGVAAIVASTALLFGVWLWASAHLPHTPEVRWTAFVPGALVVAIGFQATQLFTTLYIAERLSRASEVYGALGVALVILFWLYLLGRLTIASAVVNATLWQRAQGEGAGGRLHAAAEE